ncbi:MAG: glycosyltransferase family 1 protein [Gemmatimonadetes bacterium]|nr:glycosyltransferase family 1 protein [Gemmatimonadota bacterium]
MRFLIVDTYNPGFLDSFYSERRDLSRRPYAEQWRALMDELFGTADYYSVALSELGQEATEVVVNCRPLQRRWAREHARALWLESQLCQATGRWSRWVQKALHAQVEYYRPDVLYVQDVNYPDPALLAHCRRRGVFVVGQTAYPLRPGLDLRGYDLLLSSLPHYVERFRADSRRAEYFRLGFDARVLERVGTAAPRFGAVFVGGYSAAHCDGTALLEDIARRVPVDFWGYGAYELRLDSPVRERFHGEVWGVDMYRVLAQARVALNRHIDLAGRYANNMRLYEATGVGACLVTDRKHNLAELFEPDREVVVYGSAAECAEKVGYLLEHEAERCAVARAGQTRTLREHTYRQRMEELLEIVARCV